MAVLAASAAAAQNAAPPAARELTPEDQAGIEAFVERYYAALNARDVDTAIRLWSRDMPSRGPMTETLVRTLKDVPPTWSDVRVASARFDGDRVRAVLRYSMSYPTRTSEAAGGSAPSFARRTLFVLTRERDEWRLFEQKTVEQELAERILAIEDDNARARLMAAELSPSAAADTEAGSEAGAEAGSAIVVIRALLGLGSVAASRQMHDEALRSFEVARQAIAFVKRRPSNPAYARTLDSLFAQALSQQALVYIYRPGPDLSRALTLLEQALAIYEAEKDKAGIGDTLLSMATAAYSGADYARALTLYERARDVHAELKDTPSLVREALGIGNVRYLFAQLDAAEREYLDAFSQAETLAIAGDMTRARQGLGRVYVAMGDYTRGRDQYLQALTLIQAAGGKGEQAATLLDLGQVEFLRGEIGEARERYQQSLAIEQEAGNVFGEGRSLYALALVDVINADAEAAIETYTRSAEAYRKAHSGDGLGQALLGRGSVWIDRDDVKAAIADFTEGLAIFEAAKNVEGMARAHLGLAIAHVTGKDAAAALTHADRAADLSDRIVMPDIRWQAKYEAGRALLLNGDEDAARAAFEDAIDTIERGRLDAATDVRSPARRAAPYAALVDWHIAHGDAARALIVADDAKRRVLEDMLQPFRARLTRGLTADRITEEQRLLGQRVSLLAQIRREAERGPAGEARVAMLQEALRAARAASGEWESAVARETPRAPYVRGESRLTSVSLDALAATLPADTALVHFVSSDDHLSVIVVTHRTPVAEQPALDVRAYRIDITRKALAELVERVEREPVSLFDLLLGPARDRIDGRAQLVIIPDDVLWTLSFEALESAPGQRVSERAAISYLPSLASWLARPAIASPQPEPAGSAQWGTAEIVDVSPMQSKLELDDVAAASTTTASTVTASTATAADWLTRSTPAGLTIVWRTTIPPAPLRLDAGRLGRVAIAWALATAGSPRTILASRDWSVWQLIGPPLDVLPPPSSR